MPVEEHSIHPSTQNGDDFRYGCHSSRSNGRAPGDWVVTRDYGSSLNGSYKPRNEWVTDTSSTGCRNIDHESHAGCRGCDRQKDMEYIKKMGKL